MEIYEIFFMLYNLVLNGKKNKKKMLFKVLNVNE